ncbi:MAG: esterase/lipase [Rhodothermales bacterium]|jgi:esterase/lipase
MNKGKLFLAALAAVGGALALGPRVRVKEELSMPVLPSDLDAYLAGAESQHPHIIPETEKKIIWAAEVGAQTPLSVVYLHGFTATRQETAPLSDIVAKELGANLFYTRLAGHGLPGKELGKARVEHWLCDTMEALAIGERLGERVVVIGMSTGGTLAAWAACRNVLGDKLAGIVLLSPNFGPANRLADILLFPWGSHIADTIMGIEQQWKPYNDRHGQYWTSRFPTRALLPMMALVRHVRNMPLENITAPVLMGYSREDTVVDVEKSLGTVMRFGSKLKKLLDLGDINDRNDHVLAGDILAPHKTEALAARIVSFAGSV